MAGLMQSPICKRPLAFVFCSSASRTSSSSLSRGRDTSKKFGQLNLDLGAKSLRRRVVVWEAAEAESRPRVIASASSTSTAIVDVKEKENENGKAEEEEKEKEKASSLFADPKWKNGSWDIQQFTKDGKVDWDAVIDAEVRRRKCLEDNPEASSNKEPVVFDTSIIPWWAWMKRFHLPQAELLNGRAAMIGFFMTYVVDSLTGVGLVDQMGSFFGKLFLFIAVTGVLLVRNNEDIENFKQIVKEFNLYDKQWQATWQDEKPEDLGQD